MPAVVAGALVSAAGLTGIAATVATAVIGAGASLTLNALTASRKKAGSTAERTELIRSSVTPRRVIYGRARVSGALVFAYSTDKGTLKNAYLHMVIALAGHEVSRLGRIYINDEPLECVAGADGWMIPPVGSSYLFSGVQKDGTAEGNGIQWRGHTGTVDQQADSYLLRDVPVWSPQHRLRGTAYLYAKLAWNASMWPSGLPTLSQVVDGRKVYDPRSRTTGWSDNPALCIRDYLLAPWGLNCAADEIDEESFIAAANLCDEPVSTSSGEQKRYTCNGVFALDEKPIDVMEQMLSSCAGALVYAQGRYRLYPAGLRPPRLTLDESQLRGAVVVRPLPSRRERVNTVKGVFIDPASHWQATDFEPVSDTAALAQESGLVNAKSLELNYTADAHTARRLACLHLQRSRHALTLEVPCTLSALDIAVMEPVRVTLPSLGLVGRSFIPVDWQLAPEGGVDLTLIEDDSTIYNSPEQAAVRAASADVVLPTLVAQPPHIQVSEQEERLIVSVSAAVDSFMTAAQVGYRRSGESLWQDAGTGDVIVISGLEAGQAYDIRARAQNVLGHVSDWTVLTYQPAGTSQPPGDITTLQASRLDSLLQLGWEVPSGRIAGYRLRWTPALSGAEWSSAVDVGTTLQSTRLNVPARAGTYLLKAYDAYGRESANPALYLCPMGEVRGSLVVASLLDGPGFAGVMDNCVVNGGGQVMIASLSAFDAQNGLFDTLAASSFDGAGGGVKAQGSYELAGSPIDLGAVYLVRATASVSAGVLDLVTDVDGAPALFDSREGLLDGTAPSAVDVLIEAAVTLDDPAGSSALWSEWQPVSMSDLTARGLRLRARLISRNLMATPLLAQVSVVLDLAERVVAGQGVSSLAGGDTHSFSAAFYDVPAITITPANMASGEYFTVSAVSRSGFNVRFFNSSGAGISRSYDWLARGHGRVL